MIMSNDVKPDGILLREVVTTEELYSAGMADTISLPYGTVILCKIRQSRNDKIVEFKADGHINSIKCYADNRFRLAYKNEKKKAFNESVYTRI